MKILKKLIKSICAVIMFLPHKIDCAAATITVSANTETLYGIPTGQLLLVSIIRIVQFCIIPIVTLIGFICYFKKSKRKKSEKIVIMLLILDIIVILYWLITIFV